MLALIQRAQPLPPPPAEVAGDRFELLVPVGSGEAGVLLALQIIQKELETSMGLCGVRSIAEIDRGLILNPY